jgi:hypothetical protein
MTAGPLDEGLGGSLQALDTCCWGLEIDAASGAIRATEGSVVITKATAAAMTLAAPTAGSPANGGDDGQRLKVFCIQAAAHTITTPSNAINGNKHVVTFANAGDSVSFIAYNGVWYVLSTTGTIS